MSDMKFKRGDIIKFTGKHQYRDPRSRVFFFAKPGLAQIGAIMPNDVKHPYYLTPIDNREEKAADVKGWVDEKDITEYVKPIKITPVSFVNSKKVKIAFSTSENKDLMIECSNWSDKNWYLVCRPKDIQLKEEIAAQAESAFAQHLLNEKFIEYVLGENRPSEYSKKEFTKTGLFHCYTDMSFLKNDRNLQRGDILIGPSIKAVVLSNNK